MNDFWRILAFAPSGSVCSTRGPTLALTWHPTCKGAGIVQQEQFSEQKFEFWRESALLSAAGSTKLNLTVSQKVDNRVQTVKRLMLFRCIC
jgi:hypothetical protein